MRSEHQEQIALFQWAAYHPELRWMHAIPNGGKRTIGVARKMKAEGVKSGVPDIFLPIPKNGYHGLYIEMKREAKSYVSSPQREAIAYLESQGYAVEVCKGAMQAIERIKEYMGWGNGD
jgi:hypothetical protein